MKNKILLTIVSIVWINSLQLTYPAQFKLCAHCSPILHNSKLVPLEQQWHHFPSPQLLGTHFLFPLVWISVRFLKNKYVWGTHFSLVTMNRGKDGAFWTSDACSWHGTPGLIVYLRGMFLAISPVSQVNICPVRPHCSFSPLPPHHGFLGFLWTCYYLR